MKPVMTYKNMKLSETKVKTKFTLYGEDDPTEVKHQAFLGTCDYELIKTIKELWKIIDENEMLPINQDQPELNPQRTRDPTTAIIGVYYPPLPDQGAARRREV